MVTAPVCTPWKVQIPWSVAVLPQEIERFDFAQARAFAALGRALAAEVSAIRWDVHRAMTRLRDAEAGLSARRAAPD